MPAPGKIYVGATKRLSINLTDDDNVDIDPTTVTLYVYSPNGILTTYVYGTDAALIKDSAGDYHCDVVPDVSGRWFFRWVTTGTITAIEGFFLVQRSVFEADSPMSQPAYQLWWW